MARRRVLIAYIFSDILLFPRGNDEIRCFYVMAQYIVKCDNTSLPVYCTCFHFLELHSTVKQASNTPSLFTPPTSL